MQTAINPETNETAVLVDGGWQKAEKIATNDAGEKAFLVGGKWLADSPSGTPAEAPKPTNTQSFGRQLGLTARSAITGAMGLPVMGAQALAGMANTALGTNLDPAGALQRNLSRIGLPEPATGGERIAGDVAGALTGTGTLAGLAGLAKPASALGQNIAQQFSSNLRGQAASAVGAAGAAGGTRELGGGDAAQVGAGLLGGIGAPVGLSAARSFMPNTLAKSIAKSEATPFAQEGQRLATETGIDLPIGPRTGNKMMLGLENASRQYGPTADRVQDIDVKIANQAIDRVSALAKNISRNQPDSAMLGTQIEDTVKNAAKDIDMRRDFTANRDYGEVRKIAGNQPVVRLNNFVDELKGIIGDYENVAGSDAQKIVAQSKAALARVTGIVEKGEPARVIETPRGNGIKLFGTPTVTGTMDNTIDEAMKTRSFYGKASKGAANVFEDISPNMNRSLAGRLFGAVNRDFDEAGNNVQGPLKQALDTANKNYRQHSQSLEFLEKSALGKLVGDDVADAAMSGKNISTTAGESVINKIADLHPSARKTSVDILQKWNPDIVQDLKAHVLRNALDEGMAIPPSAKGAGQVPLSFNRFVSALGSQKVGFEKNLQSYGFTPKEIADIKDTAVAMMRAGDKTGYNFSNTGVLQENMQMAGALGHAAASGFTGNVMSGIRSLGGGILSIAGKRMGMNKIVDAMASEEGRRALKVISKPSASPAAVVAAFDTIERSSGAVPVETDKQPLTVPGSTVANLQR